MRHFQANVSAQKQGCFSLWMPLCMEAHVGSCVLSFCLRIFALPFAERAQASEGDSMPERMGQQGKGQVCRGCRPGKRQAGPKADAATDKARSVASNAQSGAQQSSGGCSHAPQGFSCTGSVAASPP